MATPLELGLGSRPAGNEETRGARAPRVLRARLRKLPGPSLAATYLSLLILLPMAAVFSKAFSGGPGALWQEITQVQVVSAFELSVGCSLIVVVVNAFAGIAVAWLLVRDRFPLNRVVGALVDLPFALPTVVAGITLVSLYGPNSPLHLDVAYTRLAILVALAFVTLPFSVRSVQPVLAALDRETEEAAASLGASPWTTFRRVTLPSLVPALLTGAGLGFARALGEYGSITIVSGNIPMKTQVASVAIFGFIENDDLPAAAAVSLLLFVVALVVLLAFSTLRRRFLPEETRYAAAPAAAASVGRRPGTRRALVRWGLRLFGLGYVGLLVGVPVGSVLWRALSPGLGSAWDAVTTPPAVHAFVLTLESAAIAVVLNTAFGVGIALILARHRFPGASLVEALVDLPLALSPVVVGLALVLFWSSREGWVGPWLSAHGITVIFSFPGIVLASAFVSLPYVVREVLPVLQELGDDQEQAAETLGAGPFTVFWRITLPTIRWGLAYGVLLTTARILGEFGAMSVVSGDVVGHTQTFTQFVADDFTNFDAAGAYAGALLLALLSLAVLAALSFSRSKEARLR